MRLQLRGALKQIKYRKFVKANVWHKATEHNNRNEKRRGGHSSQLAAVWREFATRRRGGKRFRQKATFGKCCYSVWRLRRNKFAHKETFICEASACGRAYVCACMCVHGTLKMFMSTLAGHCPLLCALPGRPSSTSFTFTMRPAAGCCFHQAVADVANLRT